MPTPLEEKLKEQLARKQHEWYLEATAKLHPESYNPNAQKSYDDLTEEQKSIDRYIAEKAYNFVYKQLLEEEIKQIEDMPCVYHAIDENTQSPFIRADLLIDSKREALNKLK